jgi:hypothetical protein
LDLAIIDKLHLSGLPPGANSSNPPDVYHPSRVASFLQDCGFDGIIQSAEVQRRDSVPGSRKRDDPPPHPETGAFRWPRYKRTPKTEIVYPATLEETGPEPFRLSLPSPTIRHQKNLLYLYSRKNPHLRLMLSLIYVWMRSWGVNEINPETLCLLLIRFFQRYPSSRTRNARRQSQLSKQRLPRTTYRVFGCHLTLGRGHINLFYLAFLMRCSRSHTHLATFRHFYCSF